jgi:hypothetical protein
MTDSDLDRCYSALCEALAQAGEARAPLMLSMVSLALMARCESADDVLPLVKRARAQLADEAAHGG